MDFLFNTLSGRHHGTINPAKSGEHSGRWICRINGPAVADQGNGFKTIYCAPYIGAARAAIAKFLHVTVSEVKTVHSSFQGFGSQLDDANDEEFANFDLNAAVSYARTQQQQPQQGRMVSIPYKSQQKMSFPNSLNGLHNITSVNQNTISNTVVSRGISYTPPNSKPIVSTKLPYCPQKTTDLNSGFSAAKTSQSKANGPKEGQKLDGVWKKAKGPRLENENLEEEIRLAKQRKAELVNNHDRVKRESQSAKQERDKLEGQTCAFREELVGLRLEKEQLQKDINLIQQRRERIENESHSIRLENERLTEESHLAKREIDTLESRTCTLREEIDELDLEKKCLLKNIALIQQQKEESEKEARSVREENEQLKKDSKSAKQEKEKLKDQARAVREEYDELELEKKRIQNEISLTHQQKEQSKKEARSVREENKSLKKDSKSVKLEKHKLKDQARAVHEECDELELEKKRIQKEINSIQQQKKESQKEVRSVREENERLKKDFKSAKQEKDKLKDQARAVLEKYEHLMNDLTKATTQKEICEKDARIAREEKEKYEMKVKAMKTELELRYAELNTSSQQDAGRSTGKSHVSNTNGPPTKKRKTGKQAKNVSVIKPMKLADLKEEAVARGVDMKEVSMMTKGELLRVLVVGSTCITKTDTWGEVIRLRKKFESERRQAEL